MTTTRFLFLLLSFIGLMSTGLAQETEVTVPDVSGLNVPQAAATLNQAGLSLGAENAIALELGGGQASGTVIEQSLASGSVVPRGSSVDVGVLRSDNVTLIYDDNDFTLINTTNNVGDITGLRFAAVEGDNPASFAASRWGSNIREQRCLQLWSITVRDSKPVSGCQDIQWLTTNATGEHFWTQTNGVQQFAVIENGVTRATCPGAPTNSQDSPTQCGLYLDGAGSPDDLVSFLYFVYTPNAIALINQSPDRWMPTDRSTIYNFNPNLSVEGASLIMGDEAFFNSPEIVADVTRLAPNQCLVITVDEAMPDLPTPCDIIAQRSQVSTIAFWLADFEIQSATVGLRHTCPAAILERPTICIIPQ
ncbi:MAG: PASTA domain-containing protein [Chloroflexota bacterium]